VSYTIELRPAALRDFKSLSGDIQRRVSRKIDSLADDPRPPGAEKLSGHENLYRVRVGDYRILYELRNPTLVIIARVGHRREVYR
jgi:mRNA interferase RelE/StbE